MSERKKSPRVKVMKLEGVVEKRRRVVGRRERGRGGER